jgi:hypothetical protein
MLTKYAYRTRTAFLVNSPGEAKELYKEEKCSIKFSWDSSCKIVSFKTPCRYTSRVGWELKVKLDWLERFCQRNWKSNLDVD